jgi:phage shock protein A
MPTFDPAERLLDLYLDGLDRQEQEYQASASKALEEADELIAELRAAHHPEAERLAGAAARAAARADRDLDAAERVLDEAWELLDELCASVAVGAHR